MENELIEYTIKVTQEYADALDALAEREEAKSEDLIMRAIGLYAMAIEAQIKGLGLTFKRIPETNDLTVDELIRFDEGPDEKSRLILVR